MRVLVSTLSLLAAALLAGCGSIAYHLPGHTAQQHTAPLQLASGQHLLALETPARLPAPGGFWLGLASENPAIVSVESRDSARGASAVSLVAHRPGETVVHYVNRFTVPRDPAALAALPAAELRALSLGAFPVTVR